MHTLVQEVRRQRMAAAAEQRQREADARGVKDPQLLKEKQARREEAEKAAASQPASAEGGLRVWLCASCVLQCTYIYVCFTLWSAYSMGGHIHRSVVYLL